MKPILRLALILSFQLLMVTFCKAKTELDSISHLVEHTKGIDHIDALNTLAGVVIANDLDRADSLLTVVHQLSLQADYKKGLLRASLLKTRILMHRYRYSEAERVLTESQALSEQLEDDGIRSRIHLSLGNLYSKRARSAEAFDQFLQGLTFANKANDADAQVTNLMNLGRLKEMSGDIAQAEDYYLNALDISESNQLKRRLMELHINMAVMEYRRNNLGLSVQHNQKAYDIASAEGDMEMSALALSNLGFAEGVMGNNSKANEYYDRSLELRQQINDQHGIGTIHIYKAKLKGTKESAEAEELGLKALRIAEDIDDPVLKLEAYSFLYAHAERLGNPEKALKYYRGLSEVKDSIDANSNKVKMLELEAAYQFEEMERQNELQKAKMDVAAVELKLRNALILGLSIIVALLSVLFVVMRKQLKSKLNRSQTEKQQIQTEAGKLTEELAVERQRLAEYTDKLLQKSLVSFSEGDDEPADMAINAPQIEALATMVSKLNAGEVSDSDWLTFNMLFSEAYPKFEKRLNSENANLTSSDIKLASLIKLKLSNKQIGAVLNISRDSVVRAKYRLRQKLGLDSNQTMESHLVRL